MIYELSVITAEGWVMTLKSDKQINLGDAIIQSIRIESQDDFKKRLNTEVIERQVVGNVDVL